MSEQINNILEKCYALTGSIATGKSTVARMLHEMGAHIIDTDLIAREVVEPGQPALEKIKTAFGHSVIHRDGTLNREAMRDLIIHDTEKKALLNSITHPEINKIVFERITHYVSLNDSMPIIIDVPLLFEAGWDQWFKKIILVYTPVATQVQRLMERDKLDRETAEKTVAAQMSIEEKKERALYVIDNAGSIDDTGKQVEEVFIKIT